MNADHVHAAYGREAKAAWDEYHVAVQPLRDKLRAEMDALIPDFWDGPRARFDAAERPHGERRRERIERAAERRDRMLAAIA